MLTPLQEVEQGYEEVEHLFALGALCCLDAQAIGHQENCVWHFWPPRKATIERCRRHRCRICARIRDRQW